MNEQLDEFHAHEAMDRTNMLCNVISGELLDHVYVQAHDDVKAKVEEAVSILANVYQMIGGLRFSEKALSAATPSPPKQGEGE